jgi:uncharacterized membrane protein
MAVFRTDRGLDRLVNFSDATVAIAITLLILPLVDAATDVGELSLGQFVDENWWELFAFLVSFVVIARFWVVHHRVFEWLEGYTPPLVWLNFLWLATIVFIPFTANVLSNSEGHQAAVYALYIGNMLVATLAMQAMGIYMQRTPGLAREDAREGMDATRGWSTSILMALALVLAVLVPTVGMFWLFVLFLSEPVHRLLRAVFVRTPSGTDR